MLQTDKKNSFSRFFSKYFIKEKDVTPEKISPLEHIMYIFMAVIFFCCITVFKLPYNAENAPLLNCYYGLTVILVIAFAIYNASDTGEVKQKIGLILKILLIILGCFGMYLYGAHYDYIQEHMSEWGGFNKV